MWCPPTASATDRPGRAFRLTVRYCGPSGETGDESNQRPLPCGVHIPGGECASSEQRLRQSRSPRVVTSTTLSAHSRSPLSKLSRNPLPRGRGGRSEPSTVAGGVTVAADLERLKPSTKVRFPGRAEGRDPGRRNAETVLGVFLRRPFRTRQTRAGRGRARRRRNHRHVCRAALRRRSRPPGRRG
jgi:hypothetical protein